MAGRALRTAALATLVTALAACTSAGAGSGAEPPDRGERLAAACNGCHGPDGRGSGAIPPLAGLDPGYLEQRLRDWRAAAEADGADHLMVRFARALEPGDPTLLADHYGSLQRLSQSSNEELWERLQSRTARAKTVSSVSPSRPRADHEPLPQGRNAPLRRPLHVGGADR